MRLEWSQRSLQELDTIWHYILGHDPAAAHRVRNRIMIALERLIAHPYMGRIGRIAGTREFVFSDLPYVGIYEIDESAKQLTIMRIVHTARYYPPETNE